MSDHSSVGPRHIAVVMDGNGRWAKRRFMPRIAGHRQGMESLRRCIRACMEQGVSVLTVFAFSSENWERPEQEVSGLMELMAKGLAREVPQLHESGVKVCFLGERQSLSGAMQQGLAQAEALTAGNTRFVFNICFNYGGQWDIVQAAQKLANAGQAITVEALSAHLSTANCGGNPDLVIRTGGEMRLSNFLLWQAAYSELVFSDKLWPDFDEAQLAAAIATYRSRERRFGKTSEQLAPANGPSTH